MVSGGGDEAEEAATDDGVVELVAGDVAGDSFADGNDGGGVIAACSSSIICRI